MPLMQLVVTLIVALAHQHRFIPMAGSIKPILNAVVVIAVIV